jgi:Lipid A 3-O-deacylase (PagL)
MAFLLVCAPGPIRSDAQVAEGERSLSLYGMAGQGFHQEGQGFSEFGTAAVAISRALSRSLELQAEWHPLMLVRQPVRTDVPHGRRETVEAFAFDIGVRWFPAPAAWRVRPYAELLDGPFYALRRVPASGSTFNFLTQAGFGVVLPARGQWQPYVFSRWVHISNAGTGHHNPDWDYWSIGVGGRLAVPGS